MAQFEIIRRKIWLENLIFSAAARAHQKVWAKEGRLYCCAQAGRLLVQLIRLYNQFFSSQNRRFLKADIRWARQDAHVQYAAFIKERKQNPPQPGFYLREQETAKNARKKSIFSYNERNTTLEKI
ncbi:MAG: hypothetical protein J6U96_05160 [Elusimicrobiaceae bacterium]|nr:hypothetical protein [Elusimicrobiaceae bacterium]